MTITQETANLIDTLASAASKIGSTEASRQLNAKIVEILGGDQEGIVEALREDLAHTQSLLEQEKEKTDAVTYVTKQHTSCAGCGEDKHTPLRVDHMGGYVCLTCIDKELERLHQLITPPPPTPGFAEMDDDIVF